MKKLTFEEFKKHVEENIKNYLPEAFADVTIEPMQSTKNNGIVLEGILVKQPDNSVSPTIYLNREYDRYEDPDDLEDVMDGIARTIVDVMKNPPREVSQAVINLRNWNWVKERLIPCLVNKEKNKEMLKDVPHKEFLDLAVVYRVVMACEGGMGSALVHHQMYSLWKEYCTEEELYEIAMNNVQMHTPPVIQDLKEVLMQMMEFASCDEEVIPPFGTRMYVISNQEKYYGASYLLDEKTLEQAAEKLQSDLVIFPSSIHELIVVSTEDVLPEQALHMVSNVNDTSVDADEILSYNAYHYSRETKQVSVLFRENIWQMRREERAVV